MPGGTSGECGPLEDDGLGASALSLSKLEESESEPVPEDEEDDEESVSESESPLISESASGSSPEAAGAMEEIGATEMRARTAGDCTARRRRLLRE